jgi:hypothetical protein
VDLSKDSRESLDLASGGAFLHLSASEARSMLNKISEKAPCTSIHYEFPEEEMESSPEQEQEILIDKSQPLQSQDLSINSKLSIPHNPNPSRKEESQLLKFLVSMICVMPILGIVYTSNFIRDLRVYITQILSRRDLFESILISI